MQDLANTGELNETCSQLYCGCFADVGAAPAAGVSSVAHRTADAASSLITRDVPTVETAALEDAQAHTTVVADLVGSTPLAKRQKSGIV